MTSFLRRESNTITIATFYENWLLKKYDFEPPYQRQSIWSDEKQSFLIDSILKNFPIPPIFLHQKINDTSGKTTYAVVDGKQRLTSIIRFINGEIPVSSETDDGPFNDDTLAGATFKDLDRPELAEYKKRFWRYALAIEYVDTDVSATIDIIFDRLNRNGEPLKGQELRNAKYHDSLLLNFVEDKAQNTFWGERLQHTDLKRMENYEFISELEFLLLEDQIIDSNQETLDNLYARYAYGAAVPASTGRFDEITKFIQDLNLDFDGFKIKGVSHLYGLWSLGWYCCNKNILPSQVEAHLKNLYERLRALDDSLVTVRDYRKSMSSRTKSRSARQMRLTAMLKHCGLQ